MIGIKQVGIPKGQEGWISKLNPKNWFKKEPKLNYDDWTQEQWDNMNQRYRNHTKVQQKTLQNIYNNVEDFKIYGLQTTPQNDSTWYMGTPQQELTVLCAKRCVVY